MEFGRLEYFVAAAAELNFTHAADWQHVSQPPLRIIPYAILRRLNTGTLAKSKMNCKDSCRDECSSHYE